ncbi:MAG: putative FAD-linked sulfhydryl oxidase [Satyrvirus sp.]|uniref:Sulfhydryl oxidase n=1 Tax=Satyrvirus sp. TaxID=2487771 RepID=A0A3G5ADU7_9VIRU|nr:MAG: putative FAD-linked sulfhydryl oxidase [Satyrvirus sp.]
MLPEVWGKSAWSFFHFVTLGYPENPTEDDKKKYFEYVQMLQYVLPCSKCRKNLTNHLKKYPLTKKALSNRTSFVKWGIDLHNIVNYHINKPMLTYAEAMEQISKLSEQNKKSSIKPIYYVLLVVAIIIICFIIYYVLKNRGNLTVI